MFIIPQLWYCSFWLLPFFQHQLTHLMSPSTGDLPPPAVWSLTTDHLVVPSRPLWPVHRGIFGWIGQKKIKNESCKWWPTGWKDKMSTHQAVWYFANQIFPRKYLLLKPGLRHASSVSMVAITWSFLTFSPTCQTLHTTPAVGCLTKIHQGCGCFPQTFPSTNSQINLCASMLV